MSVLVIPNVFVTGTVINAGPFNTNFNAVATSVNSVDNTNIGAAGLFASQLLPTTGAQGTFSATTVGVGFKFLAGDATAVPLTVSAIAGQTADIQDWTLTSGGTKAMWLTNVGAANIGANSNASTAGDLCVGRSATTARLGMGAIASYFDYGLINTGAFTVSAQFNANGSTINQTGFNTGTSGVAGQALSYGGGAGIGSIGTNTGSVGATASAATAFSVAISGTLIFGMNASSNATIAGATYQTGSSEKLKTEIQALSLDSIQTMKAISIKSFYSIYEEKETARLRHGPIAEELPDGLHDQHSAWSNTETLAVVCDAVKRIILTLEGEGRSITAAV